MFEFFLKQNERFLNFHSLIPQHLLKSSFKARVLAILDAGCNGTLWLGLYSSQIELYLSAPGCMGSEVEGA